MKIGDIIDLRHRLWRVDFVNDECKIFQATDIDSGRPRQQQFYYPLETVREAHIPEPSLDRIGDSLQTNCWSSLSVIPSCMVRLLF
jgi:hypothetical protein